MVEDQLCGEEVCRTVYQLVKIVTDISDFLHSCMLRGRRIPYSGALSPQFPSYMPVSLNAYAESLGLRATLTRWGADLPVQHSSV